MGDHTFRAAHPEVLLSQSSFLDFLCGGSFRSASLLLHGNESMVALLLYFPSVLLFKVKNKLGILQTVGKEQFYCVKPIVG